MYINWFWIAIAIVVLCIYIVSKQNQIKKIQESFLEQREITSVFMQIASKHVHSKQFAQEFVYRMIYHANISSDNLANTLRARGVDEGVAILLSTAPDDDDTEKDAALKLAIGQIVDRLKTSDDADWS